jgi:glycerol uptake facilitator-like aquaporin
MSNTDGRNRHRFGEESGIIVFGGPVTGGSVNPARSLGPMLVAGDLTSFWLYILGPIIGGALAALLYDRTMAQTQGPA